MRKTSCETSFRSASRTPTCRRVRHTNVAHSWNTASKDGPWVSAARDRSGIVPVYGGIAGIFSGKSEADAEVDDARDGPGSEDLLLGPRRVDVVDARAGD